MIRQYIFYPMIILIIVIGCDKKAKVKDTVIEKSIPVDVKKGSYNIDTSESELNWVGKELSTKIHTGTLGIKSGEITVTEEGVISGVVKINMTNINVTDLKDNAKSYLEGHLRSPDFFHVESYPTASITFKSDNMVMENNRINFNAELTIKDTTHPIVFTAELLATEPKLKARAGLSFDRSKYDVRFRSGRFFENLGDKLIHDDIDIEILLVTENI